MAEAVATGFEQLEQLIEDRDEARKRLEETEERLRAFAARVGQAIGANAAPPAAFQPLSPAERDEMLGEITRGSLRKTAKAAKKGTRQLSAAGRAAISAAAKRRWAKAKRAKKAAGK